ncbi:MAG: CDP-alcohol phosphatidyltransferase family protein [Polyangiaceae bacterium]|nr:CDP-alcohol phosphatidyltransferase family protein [Polyangiaceae bacterium]
MFERARSIYRATKKRHDQRFNIYVARPVAALVVAAVAPTRTTPNQLTLLNLAIFVAGAAWLAASGERVAAIGAAVLFELSYVLDCADGMLARHKQLASRQGHLFDFFTDEAKAVSLTAALSLHLWQGGGYGPLLERWPAYDARFLLGGVGAVVAVSSALSLTTFVRRPELTGEAGRVEAHYEALADAPPPSLIGRVRGLVGALPRLVAQYPTHIWLTAAIGRLDLFFWAYAALHALFLARGWLGLARRFGRFAPLTPAGSSASDTTGGQASEAGAGSRAGGAADDRGAASRAGGASGQAGGAGGPNDDDVV